MKIILATSGSRGDVQPMLALALALQNAGHEVLLLAPPENANWVKDYSRPFQPFGSNFEDFLDEMKDAHTLKAAVTFLRFVRREIDVQFSQFPLITRKTDLILAASLCVAAPSFAELLGIPYRFIAFCPQLLPSRFHPAPAIRNHSLPLWLNRQTWWLDKKADGFLIKSIINKKRDRMGLKPIHSTLGHLLGNPVMVASDPVLGSVPMDVEQDTTQTGYFHLHQTDKLIPDLEAFLVSGASPVYVGFGSMPKRDLKGIVQLVMEAGRSAGQRLIISIGKDKNHLPTSGDCFFADKTPHKQLFPRVSVVVHHGGSGTTATAARAGIPQIIIPHILDQYYWGDRIHRAGLGPKPIRRSLLTAKRLADAISESLSNDAFRRRAKQVADIIQGQDSIGQAVHLIESEFG